MNQRHSLFCIASKRPGRIWFRSLERDKIQNLGKLLNIVLLRFTAHEQNWNTASSLLQMKERADEKVQDFIAKILVKTQPQALATETIFNIALNGT